MFGFGAGRAAKLASHLLLARLLAPEAFGLWALVGAIITGLQMFSDVGIGPSIVQNSHGDKPRFLNTAFSIQVSRGFVLGLLCLLAGAPIAEFYNQPALKQLLWIAALSPIISGLASTSVWSLTRNVNLRNLTILGFVADISGAVLAIVWALINPTVWALLAGNLTTVLTRTVGTHFLLPEKNRLQWHREYAGNILHFGAGIFLSTATAFLSTGTERLVLGRFIDIGTLGVISIVLLITKTAMTAITQPMTRVFFPMISDSIRQSTSSVDRRFTRVGRLVLAGSIPLAAAFLFGGEPAFSILLDQRYADAGWIFEIIAIRVILGANMSPMGHLLLAGGYSRYAAIGNTLRFLVLLSGIIAGGTFFDVHFICWVLALSALPDCITKLIGLRLHFPPAFAVEVRHLAVIAAVVVLFAWLS
jgi:O-antigen/teichoic acid export membrane protein